MIKTFKQYLDEANQIIKNYDQFQIWIDQPLTNNQVKKELETTKFDKNKFMKITFKIRTKIRDIINDLSIIGLKKETLSFFNIDLEKYLDCIFEITGEFRRQTSYEFDNIVNLKNKNLEITIEDPNNAKANPCFKTVLKIDDQQNADHPMMTTYNRTIFVRNQSSGDLISRNNGNIINKMRNSQNVIFKALFQRLEQIRDTYVNHPLVKKFYFYDDKHFRNDLKDSEYQDWYEICPSKVLSIGQKLPDIVKERLVRDNPRNIFKVGENNKKLQDLVLRQDPSIFHELWNMIAHNVIDPEMCELLMIMAVKEDPMNIQYINKPTRSFQEYMIENKPWVLTDKIVEDWPEDLRQKWYRVGIARKQIGL